MGERLSDFMASLQALIEGGVLLPWLWGVLGVLGLFTLLGLVALFFLIRFARRRWREGARDLQLAQTSEGRTVLAKAREIRSGTRRVVRGLEKSSGDPQEARALRTLLERFVQKDLPDTVERALSFAALGGAQGARRLSEAMVRLQRQWEQASDGEARDGLSRVIAKTRHRLAQTEEANAHLARLLEGLEDAASALRLLEIEWASLEAERSPTLKVLRSQLSETAEGLRMEREAYRSLTRED